MCKRIFIAYSSTGMVSTPFCTLPSPFPHLRFRNILFMFSLLPLYILFSMTTFHHKNRNKIATLPAEGRKDLHPTNGVDIPVPLLSLGRLSIVGRKLLSFSDDSFREYFDFSPRSQRRRPERRIPRHAEKDVCWIFTCADRELKYSQKFKGDGFRHFHLGMPSFIAKERRPPVWCRVGHLREIMNTGQRCVIYTDDDIYLNLTSLQHAIKRHPAGSILTTSAQAHGMKKHINAGFIVFTDIQSSLSRYVVESWYVSRLQPRNIPLGYLRDQAALNRIISCQFDGVVCYNRRDIERFDVGYLKHCFSQLDKRRAGAKEECMREMKEVVAPWDADNKN